MTPGFGKFTLSNSLTISIFSGHEKLKVSSCPDKMDNINELVKVNSPSSMVNCLGNKYIEKN